MAWIGNRRVFVNTAGTQTVKICTSKNIQGQYEKYYRLQAPFVLTRQDMERQIQGFHSLAELENWLINVKHATRETDKEIDGSAPNSSLANGEPCTGLFSGTAFRLDVAHINNTTRERLAMHLVDCYTTIKRNLATVVKREAYRPGGRGQLRQVTTLSRARIRANLNQRDWELTLERTIVETQRNRANRKYDWWNQFNVASGIGGSDEGRRVAVDLVRESHHARRFDLIELKAWNAQDEPYDAAWEVIRYCLAFIILGKEKGDPCYGHLHWPLIERARMFVLAPDTWRVGDADRVMQLFHDAFQIAGKKEPALNCCTFWPKTLRLTGISMLAFRKLLYHPTPLKRYDNLYQDGRIDRIHNWIDDAFRDVDTERYCETGRQEHI